MAANISIGFRFFYRFLLTATKRHRAFSWERYWASMGRYGLDESELFSLRSCSKALFHKEVESKTATYRA